MADVFAQSRYLTSFQNYEADFFSHPVINTIFQDREGFVWTGTHAGLDRFDGTGVKHWPMKALGLEESIIEAIGQDNDGILWIKCFHSSGQWALVFIDPVSEAVIPLSEMFPDGCPLPLGYYDAGRWATSFRNDFSARDAQGRLYFGSVSDPVVLRRYGDGKFTEFPLPSLTQYVVKTVDREGNVWGAQNGTLICVDSLGNICGSYPNEGYNSIFYAHPVGDEIYYWVYRHPIENEVYGRMFKITADGNRHEVQFPGVPERGMNYFYNPYYDVFICYAFAKDVNTMYVYDVKQQKVLQTLESAAWPQSIPWITDHTGDIWLASYQGMSKMSLTPRLFDTYLSFPAGTLKSIYNATRGIAIAHDSIYINFELGGAVAADLKSGEWREVLFLSVPSLRQRGSYWGRSAYRDADQTILFGSEVGLYHFDPYQGTMHIVADSDSFKHGFWSLHRDANHTLWCGTLHGLCSIDESGDTPVVRRVGEDGPQQSVYDIQSQGNLLWLCTEDGLYRYNTAEQKFTGQWNAGAQGESYLPANSFRHLLHAPDQITWLATANGLVRWDRKESSFILYNREDGFADDNLYAVYPDANGYLWMSHDLGITQFGIRDSTVHNYLLSDGLSHSEFNRISHTTDANGRLYFGGLNGVTAFHPADFASLRRDPKPMLTISSYHQFLGKANRLMDMTGKVRQSGMIIMRPEDSFFQLDLAFLVFENQELIRYESMVEGVDASWQPMTGSTIRQGRLPYGEHVMKFRALHPSGEWSDEVVLQIEMERPFYQSAWFIILLAIVISGATWVGVYTHSRRLKRRQLVLEQEIIRATEKIRLDKQTIEQQAQELLQLDNLKSQFFTNVSHELRTPLTLMLGPISSVLKSKHLTSTDRGYLETAHANGGNLLRLISSILNLSKLESGHLKVQDQQVKLYPLMQKIFSAFATYAQISEIQFQVVYDADRELQVLVDKDKLEMVLNNLLSNAIKFTPSGGSIRVTVQADAASFSINVTDTGRGIPADDLPHIFDRFYQAKNGSQAQEGTGIGLALTRQFVEVMQGEIRVKSTVGIGTSFTVSLPLRQSGSVQNLIENPEPEMYAHAEHANREEAGNSENLAATGPHAQSRIRVLIVEDHPELRHYMKGVIAPFYAVETAMDGKDAWENFLPLKPFDVVISDVMMPHMDGFELLEKMKSDERLRAIPVVMVTARSDIRDKVKALRIGVDDYILKPFVEEELLARIENLLKYRAMRQVPIVEAVTPEVVEANEVEVSEGNGISTGDQQWLATLEGHVMNFLSDSRFSMDFIAAQLDMSRRHLQRTLKRVTGLTPNEYVLEIRLHKARTLLEDGMVKSVRELAEAVGYADASHFSKVFKERFGKSPSGYLQG